MTPPLDEDSSVAQLHRVIAAAQQRGDLTLALSAVTSIVEALDQERQDLRRALLLCTTLNPATAQHMEEMSRALERAAAGVQQHVSSSGVAHAANRALTYLAKNLFVVACLLDEEMFKDPPSQIFTHHFECRNPKCFGAEVGGCTVHVHTKWSPMIRTRPECPICAAPLHCWGSSIEDPEP